MNLVALALAGLLTAETMLPLAQAAAVVAESTASGSAGVAALQATLGGGRRYLLQIDGPEGTPFVARYFSVHVSRTPSRGGTGNDDGSFEATTPYEQELVAAWPDLVFWRYSIVVSPQTTAEVAVRVIDLGPR